ncbi:MULTISPECIES: C40 family peptidase [Prochlorococcus]|uniref:C40 family peptidase n=1 Tax=Prochlorococcus TaxID=1218 RepID=UPI000533AAF4|nr:MULTISPECIES: C40 family peptidase [Prochlorococcus]KGG13549.1 hypothetical protein EV05_0204 [Prochlorococcus sp. MIT 0601]
MTPNSLWELKVDVNGYKNKDFTNKELVTQACKGRSFEVIENKYGSTNSGRVKVRLLEDGYICWLNIKDIESNLKSKQTWKPSLISKAEIQSQLPKILKWIERASHNKNKYLWGGTLGPDFDCSGLIQTAFALKGIWLPRDSYQQEQFCEKINFKPNDYEEVMPGDLLFFGSKAKCTHVGIYKAKGLYWHSSGPINGRNGIGIDQLQPTNENPISSFYQSKLRSIGRVVCCHDGRTLP